MFIKEHIQKKMKNIQINMIILMKNLMKKNNQTFLVFILQMNKIKLLNQTIEKIKPNYQHF